MGDYLVLHAPGGAEDAVLAPLRAAIEACGDWRLEVEGSGFAVYGRGSRAPKVQVLPQAGGVVIGELFDSAAAREGRARDFDLDLIDEIDPLAIAQRLTKQAWGRYVAVLQAGDGPPLIYRDPMGALECLTWTLGPITLVSSMIETGRAWSPKDLAIDWTRLGYILADNVLASQACPLRGVVAAAPGVARFGAGAGQGRRLWRPGDVVRQGGGSADPAALARVVDGCVAALARDRSAILVEISGGLDSAIVAASLARCGAKVTAALNYYWPEPEGDERVWARRIAARCGFELIATPRARLRIDGDTLARHAGAPRPGLNAQDMDLDFDIAAQAMALSADGLMSGQGGDAVFYQMAHHALAADILAGAPTPRGRARSLACLARRSRTTVWALLAKATSPLSKTAPGIPPPSFLPEGAARGPAHDWVADHQGLSRAKRIQIRALTNCQNAFGASLRGQAADLLYPLMAQPVVEACLAIPAPILAIGALDRPFARAAFADRLPPESLQRRAKGDVTVFFAKSLAASLGAVRPYLLEGELARAGLIDRAQLEPLLHAEPMIWRDCVGEVMMAAYLEAWVRAWRPRLCAA